MADESLGRDPGRGVEPHPPPRPARLPSDPPAPDPGDPPEPGDPPDGGYGWLVVLGSFLIHLVVLGNVYAFGVLYPVLVEAFDSSLGSTAWIGSIAFGITTGAASLTGAWADKYGNQKVALAGGVLMALAYFLSSTATELWHLFFTHGVMAGFGYSMSFVAAVSVVSQWFSSRRALAVGMAVSGSGMGQFAVSLVSGYLFDSLGWRTALQYLALMNLAGVSLGALLIRRRLPTFQRQRNESSLVYFANRSFRLLYAGVLLGSLGFNMQFVHIAQYALVHGLSYAQATLLVAAMGVGSAAGRVGVGFLADRFGVLAMFRSSFVLSAVATFCWIACTTFPTLLLFSLCFGICGGGIISLMPSVTALLFGLEQQGNALGLMFTSTACGGLLSSPIAGFIFDRYGVYYPSIVVAGLFIVCGTVFVMLVPDVKPEGVPPSPPQPASCVPEESVTDITLKI